MRQRSWLSETVRNVPGLVATLALAACGSRAPATDGGVDAGNDAGPSGCLSLDAGAPSGPFDISAFLVDGGVPIEVFPQALAARVCADIEKCLPLSTYEVASCEQEVLQTGNFCNLASAPGLTSGTCISLVAIYFPEELQAGRLIYDPATAASCLSSAFEGCYGPLPSDQMLCQNAIHGLVPDGGNCFEYNECRVGEQCPGPCGGDICEPRADGGLATCDFIQHCNVDAGLACNAEGYCVPAVPADGGLCDTVADCPPGLVCGGGAGGGLGAGNWTCNPLAPPVSSCKGDLDCDYGLSMYCADGGTCELPRIADGGACAGSGCAPNLVCRGSWSVFLPDGGVEIHPGTCGPASDVGGPCIEPQSPAESPDCAYGLVCSCGGCAPAPESGPCGPNASCGIDYFCDVGGCEPLAIGGLGPNCRH